MNTQTQDTTAVAVVSDAATIRDTLDKVEAWFGDQGSPLVKDARAALARIEARRAPTRIRELEAINTQIVRHRDSLGAALREIAQTARWYADNGQRLAHEVDHALCVEILSRAEDALGEMPVARPVR